MTASQRPLGAIAFAILTIGLVLTALTAAMLSAGRVDAANPDHVEIVNLAFNPATLTVQAGDTVTWTNNDGLGHTATSDAGAPDAFDSGTIAPGDSFAFIFTVEGTYAYHCAIHASMHGTIVVEAAAASQTAEPSVPDGAVGGVESPTGLPVLVTALVLLSLLGLAAIATRRAVLR